MMSDPSGSPARATFTRVAAQASVPVSACTTGARISTGLLPRFDAGFDVIHSNEFGDKYVNQSADAKRRYDNRRRSVTLGESLLMFD